MFWTIIIRTWKIYVFYLKFSYYNEQSLNNFEDQDYEIHYMCNVIIKQKKNNEKKCNII